MTGNSFSQVMLGDIDHIRRVHGADGKQQIVTTFANGGELRLTVTQAAEYVATLVSLIGPELDRLVVAEFTDLDQLNQENRK